MWLTAAASATQGSVAGSGVGFAATLPWSPGVQGLAARWRAGQGAGLGDQGLGVREGPRRVFWSSSWVQAGKTVALQFYRTDKQGVRPLSSDSPRCRATWELAALQS